ncbi:hypothetical protein N9N67_11325 [Bacteriovoracaceae bacterium]|nr:hypothetical protein [Bacteriovoracaceae bacterium]
MNKSELNDKIQYFFNMIESIDDQKWDQLIDKYISEEAVEIMASHVQKMYELEDDDEITLLTQIMATGYLCASEVKEGDPDPVQIKYN